MSIEPSHCPECASMEGQLAAMQEEINRLEGALAASGNYVADHAVYPQRITFANGRVVKMVGQGHLFVGKE